MIRKRALFGIVAAATYLGVVWLTSVIGGLPVRPLYDGLAPPAPYRYVNPPPDLAQDNETPLSAVGTLLLEKGGSRARTVATADGQMLVVFADGAVPPREGESEVSVRVTPLDPARLPTAPDGLEITGNAYRVEASYTSSGKPVEMKKPATVVLRYPTHATVVLRLSDGAWRRLSSDAAQASLQLFAETTELGTFATAGVPEPSRAWIAYAAAGGGVVAGAAGYLAGRQRIRKRPRRARRPRTRRPR